MQYTQKSQESSSAQMHLRCPKCFKLYVVDAKTIYIEKPEFQCTQCEQHFWVNFPEALEYSEVVAFPVEWSENYQENEIDADKIAKQSFSDELDLGLMSKMTYESSWKPEIDAKETDFISTKEESKLEPFEEAQANPFETTDENLSASHWTLEHEWEKVLNNYELRAYHEDFIQEGLKLGEIDFVYAKYKDIKDANPFDSTAKKHLRKVENLMHEQALEGQSASSFKVSARKPSKSLKDYYKYLPWISLALAGVLIAVGFMSEPLNHLAGFGFAIIFLTGALSLLKESDL